MMWAIAVKPRTSSDAEACVTARASSRLPSLMLVLAEGCCWLARGLALDCYYDYG